MWFFLFLTFAALSTIIAVFENIIAFALDSGNHFTYDITPDLTCCGDASSVRQLFTILLDNAFKYSSGKGNIDFKLYSSGSYIVLIVSNDVDNIDKNLTDRMFDRFYRADSTSA